jgi:citrate lyase subunit alpha / citrate CoA-transferase
MVDRGFVCNAAGREVPTEVNGRTATPYQGVGGVKPVGRRYGPPIPTCADYPENGDKIVPSLREALVRAGLRDGMTLSTHHHFRDGDLIANQIFAVAAELGVRDLVWAPSASFPCHQPLIEHMESGVIHHIEGSMNGPLGRFCSAGRMHGTGVLRSHGGRHQAIQDGELHIDIAVIAASAADCFGNANGLTGPAACGPLSYAEVDALYADRVIVVTDNLVPFPCVPWQIQGTSVDYTVVVDQVGIPEKIISGTTKVTRSPERLLLAEMTARFCEDAGLLHQGFSYQAGAGSTSLAIGDFLAQGLEQRGLTGRFARGGSTANMVRMLENGLLDYILDGQAFDLQGVHSMRKNLGHVSITPLLSYNYHSKGNFTAMLDVAVLGATEVDVNFNANVVSHSDGTLAHGIGGWQNCLFAKCVILPVPLFRDRIPTIRDRVTTLCGPGELIDVVVTERGIAVNPLRTDLLTALAGSSLPIVTIQELQTVAEKICGRPAPLPQSQEVVAVVKWVDGTLLDTVRRVMA